MSRTLFGGGSNLPPGCTDADIERAAGAMENEEDDMNSLSSLDAILEAAADPRGWARVTFRKVCRNCGSTYTSEPQIMREDQKGYLGAADRPLPEGAKVHERVVDTHYARCEKCNGRRPLADDIRRALDGTRSDRELMQRLEVILADHKRKSTREAS